MWLQYILNTALLIEDLLRVGKQLVLPTLLRGLDETKWRAKVGSIQLLGAMAFCAPKQLAAALPKIVPALADCLNETHPKVRSATSSALDSVGKVVRYRLFVHVFFFQREECYSKF